MSGSPLSGNNPPIDSNDLIWGYRQIIARAHRKGIKVTIGTITPRVGSKDFTPEKERIRKETNRWILTSREADGYIDFDRIIQDPKRPDTIQAIYDSGDHLHPSDAGYAKMGDAIDLKLFP